MITRAIYKNIVRISRTIITLLLTAAVLINSAAISFAEIRDDNAFDQMEWREIVRLPVLTENGNMQSICITDKYLIAMENVNDDPDVDDIVSAYYLHDTDEDGNAVEQYSLAMRVQDHNWEHCNGMAFNPNTGLVYVAPYTHNNEENRGCVLLMDPDTLAYVGSIQVTDAYDILGIAYEPDQDRYILQSNVDGEYRFLITDADFEILQDLGPADLTPGNNSQDMCAVGDYVINSPLTFNMGIGEYVNVYSLERNQMIRSIKLPIVVEEAETLEPESFEELSPGLIWMDVSVHYKDGSRGAIIYETEVPYVFEVKTNVENGTITATNSALEKGSSFTVSYAPAEGYHIASIEVDGEVVDKDLFRDEFVFTDIEENHTVTVLCEEGIAANPREENELAQQQVKDALESANAVKPEKKPVSAKKIILMVLLLLVIVLFVGWILLLQHVRKERERKRQKSRAARDKLRRELDEARKREWEELGEMLGIDLDDEDFDTEDEDEEPAIDVEADDEEDETDALDDFDEEDADE